MDFSSHSMSPLSFTPQAKIAPVIVGGALLVGRAVAGGVIGGATSWGVNRVLNNTFPSRK